MQTNGSRQDFEIIDKSINSQNALSEEPPKTNQDEDGEGNQIGSVASFDGLVKTAIERQENIIYAIGEDSSLPLVDDQVNVSFESVLMAQNYIELAVALSGQLTFLFDFYEEMRKRDSMKFSTTQVQRNLVREKEHLNTLLKQQVN